MQNDTNVQFPEFVSNGQMGTNPVICWDLDGTLFDARHRLHHVESGKTKNWKAFFAEIPFDEPFAWIINSFHFLARSGFDNHFVTARPDNLREVTSKQILQHISDPGDLKTHLHMRPTSDHRADVEVKQEIVWRLFREGYNVVAAYDDREPIARMYAAYGIQSFLCSNGNVVGRIDDSVDNTLNHIFGKAGN